MQLELSVVDQAPVRKGGSAGEALREAIALAVATEKLGYTRYWVAEHHNLPSLAATSPEILIGQIAAHTETMRVGSGGVMLMHYSALKVAENFRMLEALYPGRIDLGLGRAPGGDQRTAAALAYPWRMRDPSHYPEQVDDLIAFLADEIDPSHPFARVHAGPTPTGVPQVWLLGSGIDSAILAAERGLPFSYAHFFGTSTEHGPQIIEAYRQRFQPSKWLAEPEVHVAVSVMCAETPDEVERMAASGRVSRINMARGVHSGIVSPEEALAHEFTPEELAFLERGGGPTAIQGTPEQVSKELHETAQRYGTPNLGVVTICYEFDARVRSYELVAQQCGLTPPDTGGSSSVDG